MFCYQCEQTAKGSGCTTKGVCGKQPETARLQDLLVHACKGIAMYAHRARQHGARDEEVDRFVVEALFTTVTNVNFDAENLTGWIERAGQLRDRARQLYEQAARQAGESPAQLDGPAALPLTGDADKLLAAAEALDIPARTEARGEVV